MDAINALTLNNSEFDLQAQLNTCLVVGGGGFVGHALAQSLADRGCPVRALTVLIPAQPDSRIEYLQGDIRNPHDLRQACKGVKTVFHVASIVYPGNFVSRAIREQVFGVNVTGTENVIDACIDSGVNRLIYTSTNNVVFDREIANGDESLPYASKFVDIYTQTKVLAEQAILSANGKCGLLTCALRPGGIYGPGDKLILFRMVEALKRGTPFTVGNRQALGDWVYIDNLISAQLLAAINLKKGSPVAGQPYFISDGVPNNTFEFLKPYFLGMGFRFPRYSIPYPIAYAVAFVVELFQSINHTYQPFLTRAEVRKVGITNYFSIEKAKREIGYIPQISQKQGVKLSLPYCKDLLSRIEVVQRPHPGWWLSVLGGIGLLALLTLQPQAYEFFAQHVTSLLSQGFLRALLFLAVVVHMLEASYALMLAKQAGFNRTARGWCFQTFLLGYPSLRLLWRRVHQ